MCLTAGSISMTEGIMNVAGIEIPSTDPIFRAAVGVHVLLGLACTFAGATAMLNQKRPGRHPRYGTIYFWCLAGVFLTSTSLAAVRWAEDYHLFISEHCPLRRRTSAAEPGGSIGAIGRGYMQAWEHLTFCS